jgi:membrane associated rhomboid family serine protease
MWVAYGWSIWVARGMDPESRGMWIGSLTGEGYVVAGALLPWAITERHEWERLVVSIFLHGGFLHILMNSAAILQLGRVLEAFTTRGRAWFTLLFSGLCGSLVTWIWAGITGKTATLSIGASGAGCGIGAALIVLSRGIPQLTEFRKQMITWVVVMLAMGLIPMISGTGHAGGAAGGAIAALIVGRRGSVRLASDRWSRGIDLATVAITVSFVIALAVNAWRVPARRVWVASESEVAAAARDLYDWMREGVPDDAGAWVERVSALDLGPPYSGERDELVAIARRLEARDGALKREDVERIATIIRTRRRR